MKEIVGLEVLELKTLQFLQRLKKKEVAGKDASAPSKRGLNVDIYQQIVEELNQKTGKQYRWNTSETKALIKARLNNGFSPENFKKKYLPKQNNGWEIISLLHTCDLRPCLAVDFKIICKNIILIRRELNSKKLGMRKLRELREDFLIKCYW